MTGIESWSTTASSNNSAAPNGFPEGMPPSGVNDSARQVMASVRTWYETAEWINLGHTPTYIGATQFSVTGDKTTTYQVGRRVKAYGTTPFTIYGTISTSAYSSVTTVTVTWDSGSLNSTLTTIWVGSATATNPSIYTSAVSGLSAAIAAGGFSKTTITGQSSTQIAAGDSIVYSDVSDSDNLKKNTVQGVFNAANDLTEDTSPAGSSDFVLTYDTSATAAKKVKPTNLLKAVNDLSTATVDTAADYFLIFDATDSAPKKALIPSSVQVAKYTYDVSSGTAGGTPTAGAWTDRAINTELYDDIGITLSSNELTLPAGTYYFSANVIFGAADATIAGVKCKFRNTADSTDAGFFLTGFHPSGGSSNPNNYICTSTKEKVTIASSKTFKIQYYLQTARTTNGLGVGYSAPAVIERYAEWIIEKVD